MGRIRLDGLGMSLPRNVLKYTVLSRSLTAYQIGSPS